MLLVAPAISANGPEADAADCHWKVIPELDGGLGIESVNDWVGQTEVSVDAVAPGVGVPLHPVLGMILMV